MKVPNTWFSNNQGGSANRSLAGVMTSDGPATQTVFVYDFFRIDENAAFGPYVGDGGQLVMEAESFDGLVGRGRKNWVSKKDRTGFAGTGAMALLPDTGAQFDTSFKGQSPELRYRVYFCRTGYLQPVGEGIRRQGGRLDAARGPRRNGARLVRPHCDSRAGGLDLVE